VEVFLARQAIFDCRQNLFGYELLFRSCHSEIEKVTDDTSSTLQVLANTLLSSGLDIVRSEAPAFINFGQDLLLSDWTSLFPPDRVVIEILETVQPDDRVIAACQELKKLGYRLALDDVTEPTSRLTEFTSFVKVDFRLTSREQQLAIAKSFRSQGKRLLAEKIETHEEFEWARQAGYDYFQGFFFAKPALLKGHRIPNVKVNALRLLQESQRTDLDFDRLESIIKCDVALTYKLFRYANCALFARSRPIAAVRHALVTLGEADIRRWIVLATLPELGRGVNKELVAHALVRARFCEMLATASSLPNPSDAFLVGMFSLLDAFVNRPLPEILREMSLPDSIREPLLDSAGPSTISQIYKTSLHYEAGEWSAIPVLARSLGLAKWAVVEAYMHAIDWSKAMLGLIGSDALRGTVAGKEILVGRSPMN
jgi:c-di-GMP-related signal transduction protein